MHQSKQKRCLQHSLPNFTEKIKQLRKKHDVTSRKLSARHFELHFPQQYELTLKDYKSEKKRVISLKQKGL